MQAIAFLKTPIPYGTEVVEIVVGDMTSYEDGVVAFSIFDGLATLVSPVDNIITTLNADDLMWMVQDQDGNLLPGVIDTRTPV